MSFDQPRVRKAWTSRLLQLRSEAAFGEMARELFQWQAAANPVYRKLCRSRQIIPAELTSWQDIPAVPQALFKEARIYNHRKQPRWTFETSGTTTGRSGCQYLLQDDVYQKISVAGAVRAGLLGSGMDLQFLAPSPLAAPRSSLSRMFGYWKKNFGKVGSRFWMKPGMLQRQELTVYLQLAWKRKLPVGLCGTAFSFMHMLDSGLPGALPLPPGSWLLETGGFKGRSRELAKPAFYRELARFFRVKDRAIWNEYGMTELSSQAYARGAEGIHQTPPWARVLVIDPVRDREVKVGEAGIVRWIDPANIDGVLAVQTNDLAVREKKGFRLLGRAALAELRGCSLTAEDIIPA